MTYGNLFVVTVPLDFRPQLYFLASIFCIGTQMGLMDENLVGVLTTSELKQSARFYFGFVKVENRLKIKYLHKSGENMHCHGCIPYKIAKLVNLTPWLFRTRRKKLSKPMYNKNNLSFFWPVATLRRVITVVPQIMILTILVFP